MKVFNFLWYRLGWAIGFSVFGILSFYSFTGLVEGYERPILSEGVFWMIIKYPALILWFVLSLGFVVLSVVCLVGFFNPSWDESTK